MKVSFIVERKTKSTIRFTEKLESETDAPKIGTIYVKKATLGDIGWKDGQTLTVELSAGDPK